MQEQGLVGMLASSPKVVTLFSRVVKGVVRLAKCCLRHLVSYSC